MSIMLILVFSVSLSQSDSVSVSLCASTFGSFLRQALQSTQYQCQVRVPTETLTQTIGCSVMKTKHTFTSKASRQHLDGMKNSKRKKASPKAKSHSLKYLCLCVCFFSDRIYHSKITKRKSRKNTVFF